MKATGSMFEAFSYHLYPAVSQRCASRMPAIGTTAGAALSREWLSRQLEIHTFYEGLRDRLAPVEPLWLTETADAVYGGNAWAATFLDTSRYRKSGSEPGNAPSATTTAKSASACWKMKGGSPKPAR